MDDNNHNRQIDALYRQHLPELLRMAGKYGHPPDVCEEIVHEAIAKVLAVQDPASIEKLRWYVVKAVRHRCIDLYRAHGRHDLKHVLLRNSAEIDNHYPSPDSNCLDAQIAPLMEHFAREPAKWRRAIEALILERQGKWAAARAGKISTRELDRNLLRMAAELAKLLKHHRRDKK